jgi:hypothetical protein
VPSLWITNAYTPTISSSPLWISVFIFCGNSYIYQLLSVTDVNTRNTKQHATYNPSLPISLESTVNSC